jgi:hypothetical protein
VMPRARIASMIGSILASSAAFFRAAKLTAAPTDGFGAPRRLGLQGSLGSVADHAGLFLRERGTDVQFKILRVGHGCRLRPLPHRLQH